MAKNSINKWENENMQPASIFANSGIETQNILNTHRYKETTLNIFLQYTSTTTE